MLTTLFVFCGHFRHVWGRRDRAMAQCSPALRATTNEAQQLVTHAGSVWFGLACLWVDGLCVLRVSCRLLRFSLCVTIALWGFKTHYEWLFLVWFVRVNFGSFKRVCGRGGTNTEKTDSSEGRRDNIIINQRSECRARTYLSGSNTRFPREMTGLEVSLLLCKAARLVTMSRCHQLITIM